MLNEPAHQRVDIHFSTTRMLRQKPTCCVNDFHSATDSGDAQSMLTFAVERGNNLRLWISYHARHQRQIPRLRGDPVRRQSVEFGTNICKEFAVAVKTGSSHVRQNFQNGLPLFLTETPAISPPCLHLQRVLKAIFDERQWTSFR